MFFIYTIIFIICPFIGLLLIGATSASSKVNKKTWLWFLLIIASIWVSLVNMYKIPENDLEWYIDSFKRAAGCSFYEWLPTSGPAGPISDIGYAIYSWSFSNFTTADTYMFKFADSFICYLIMGYAMIKFIIRFKVPTHIAITSLWLLLFIPYIFTMSLQLVRQFFAGCILVFVMCQLLFYENIKSYLKHNWILLLLMFSFHKTSFFFIVLLLIPWLDKPYRDAKIKYLIILGCIVGYQIVALTILNGLGMSETTAIGTVLSRASNDTQFELEAMGASKIMLIVIYILCSLYITCKSKFLKNTPGVRHFANIIIILCAFILMNLHQTELSNRFYFYLLPFFPFIFILTGIKFKLNQGQCVYIMLATIILWVWYVYNGVWKYNLPGHLLSTSIISYLI